MKRAIICDIDGVICPVKDRLHYIDNKRPKSFDGFSEAKNWNAFHESGCSSQRVEWLSKFVRNSSYNLRALVLYVTGRNERFREKTRRWLSDNEFFANSESKLFMRPDDCRIPSYQLKAQIYDEHIKGKYDVLYAIDDNKDCQDMYKNQLGLNTFCVMEKY